VQSQQSGYERIWSRVRKSRLIFDPPWRSTKPALRTKEQTLRVLITNDSNKKGNGTLGMEVERSALRRL
jgi:hypothetical protein